MYDIFVLNLDRHTERLEIIAKTLDAQGIKWSRFPGIDAQNVYKKYLDELVAPNGPIPRMPNGAQACTAGHMKILQYFITSEASHAIILEDDAELSKHFARDLPRIIEANPTGILNLNRQTPSGSRKHLVVGKRNWVRLPEYEIYDLKGIHYGTAGYVIDKDTAKYIVETFKRPNAPIDHIFFNPNISPLFGNFPIRQIFPALVRPRKELETTIQSTPVHSSKSIKNKIKRTKAEISIAPRLLLGLLVGLYQNKELEFKN